MAKLVSELIGMPLLGKNGERIGYVKNVQTDKNLRCIRNLECVSEEDEEEFTLSAAAVAQWGKDALVAARRSAGAKNCPPAPFGIEVFSQTGERLGAAEDFALDGLNVTAVVLTGGALCPVSALQSITDVAIAGGEQSALRRARRKPAAKGAPRAQSAVTEQSETAEAPRAVQNRAETGDGAENEPQQTAEKRAGSTLLTGKVLPDALTDARGRVLAPRGAVVDAAIIRRALQNDKLFALTLLCTRGRQ